MKPILLVAIPLALTAMPLAAQDHSGHAMPAAPATPAATAAKFSLDTPIQTLLADPAAKAVVEANLPGISTHPQLALFQSASLSQVAGMAPDRMPADKLQKIKAELAALK